MRKHILVVDDDQGIREVIRIILEENGYQTTALEQDKDIEKTIRKIKPDLLLLDIWIAGKNGCEVIERIRSNRKLHFIPIIMTSAKSDGENLAKKYGADDFLAKPFEIEELLKKIHVFVQ